MFRPLRRTKNLLPESQAKSLLKNEKRGILAVNGDDGYPYAIPVDYYYDGEKIYFHGAKSGHKVDALKKNNKVCFTVYGHEEFKEDWAPYLQSTVVFGICQLIENRKLTEEKVRLLASKYYPSKEEIEVEIHKAIRSTQLYEITIQHLCGKQIQEK